MQPETYKTLYVSLLDINARVKVALGDDDAQWNHEVVLELIDSKEYQLSDAFLSMLRQLLSDERVLLDEVKSHLFPRE